MDGVKTTPKAKFLLRMQMHNKRNTKLVKLILQEAKPGSPKSMVQQSKKQSKMLMEQQYIILASLKLQLVQKLP